MDGTNSNYPKILIPEDYPKITRRLPEDPVTRRLPEDPAIRIIIRNETIVFRKTGGWSGVGGFGGVGGNEEEFLTSYSSMGDLSVIKGANKLWPTNWVNMLEFPAAKFFNQRVCQTSTDSCDWRLLVEQVAAHLKDKITQLRDPSGERLEGKAAFLTTSLLYQQISLFYHATKCANLEETHCPQPCSRLSDPCAKYPGTKCQVVTSLSEKMMRRLHEKCLESQSGPQLLINNIRSHKCVCESGLVSLLSLRSDVNEETQKREKKAYWDSNSKEPVWSYGSKQKHQNTDEFVSDRELENFVRAKTSQGILCVKPEELPAVRWKIEL
ncbi:uncharacterized protein LOC142353523 [Convolutriloba macropyga]|uniref:uncharacterized protein LOC142353523 n=1 Tax=Convolutriloba macropyga TaxID=536237 RepID=UPI003F51B0A6